MNNEQFFHKLRTNFEHGLELMKRKNHDYAGEEDCFRNFRASEMFGVTVEQSILVRMSEKLIRASNLLKMKRKDNDTGYDGSVRDETVIDTLGDLMNYSNILMVYLQSYVELQTYEEKMKRMANLKSLKQVGGGASGKSADIYSDQIQLRD